MKPTCDLYDDFGEALEMLPIDLKSYGGRTKFHGTVETVKCFEDNTPIKKLSRQAGNGRVLIVDAGGSRCRAVLGDMIGADLLNNGWAGIIIWGLVRDVEQLAELDFGVLALGRIPSPGKRLLDGQIGINIKIGDARISSGSFVVVDLDGAVVFAKDGPRP